jgi:hypothetical protein
MSHNIRAKGESTSGLVPVGSTLPAVRTRKVNSVVYAPWVEREKWDLMGSTRKLARPLPSNHPRCDHVMPNHRTVLCNAVL